MRRLTFRPTTGGGGGSAKSTYGGGGSAKSTPCVRGGGGVKNGRFFAYVLVAQTLCLWSNYKIPPPQKKNVEFVPKSTKHEGAKSDVHHTLGGGGTRLGGHCTRRTGKPKVHQLCVWPKTSNFVVLARRLINYQEFEFKNEFFS